MVTSAKYPSALEAMHLFAGLRVGENFIVYSVGGTLRRRPGDVEWHVSHYPQGFDGDSHPAGEFTRYPSALAFAKKGKCEECSPLSYVAWDGSERLWLKDNPSPDSAPCYDCGRPYSAIGDCSIALDIWKRISPTGGEGGILCPNCMLERMHALGISNVTAVLW